MPNNVCLQTVQLIWLTVIQHAPGTSKFFTTEPGGLSAQTTLMSMLQTWFVAKQGSDTGESSFLLHNVILFYFLISDLGPCVE